MKQCLLILLFFTSTQIKADDKADQILEEGKLLYRLEKASWNATDDFLMRSSHLLDQVGGYLSYESKESKVVTIFFSRSKPYEIMHRYTFDSLPAMFPIEIDSLDKSPNELELDLITIRQDAMSRLQTNSDGFFSFYENSSLNPIPIIDGKTRRVFIIAGASVPNLVLLGNDYLLEYNKKNQLKEKNKIHNSLIQFPYSGEGGNTLTSTMHSHVLSDYISSTDICTLLLYREYVEWKQHTVISKKYVSILDMDKETLAILTREAWDRISRH